MAYHHRLIVAFLNASSTHDGMKPWWPIPDAQMSLPKISLKPTDQSDAMHGAAQAKTMDAPGRTNWANKSTGAQKITKNKHKDPLP